MYVHGMLDGVVTVHLREVGIEKHCSDFVQESVVHSLGDPIVLWGVGGGQLMSDPFALEEGLNIGGGIFPAAVGADDFNTVPSF